MVAEKAKALETAILHIEREFGKGAIMRLGEATRSREALDALSTGSHKYPKLI